MFPVAKIAELINSYLFYKRSQNWNREQMEAYQNQKLQRLISHAAQHVPYYRNLFRKIGFNPSDFRGREDMRKIPLLDKETLRTRQTEFIAENAEQFGIHWESTSGSTGTPLHFAIDTSTQINKLTALLRSYHWAGYTFGKRTFSLQSYYIKNADYEFKRLFNVLRFDSNRLKKESALKVIHLINQFKPKFFMGFPFDLVMLSRFAEEEGIPIFHPDSMVTYGETLSQRKREIFETAYRCRVFDYYSQHECAVMISECENHRKHFIEDFVYHEVVDEDGNPLNEGMGELVGTSLYNYAMPFIRYRTRDAVIINREKPPCQCGRPFDYVQEIIGKQCDYIETPDGRFLGAVMSHSIDNARGVIVSQCVQEALNNITVHLVVDSTYDHESQVALEAGLRKRLGDDIHIDFRIVSQLEKSRSGKTPFILSRIGHEYV